MPRDEIRNLETEEVTAELFVIDDLLDLLTLLDFFTIPEVQFFGTLGRYFFPLLVNEDAFF